jgi:hypothetical protein
MSDTSTQITREQVEDMIMAKVIEDPVFAARLKADAKAALSEMLETELPADLEISVFQETPQHLMIRLPIIVTGELSEAELEGVAGGLKSMIMLGFKLTPKAKAKLIGGTVSGGRWDGYRYGRVAQALLSARAGHKGARPNPAHERQSRREVVAAIVFGAWTSKSPQAWSHGGFATVCGCGDTQPTMPIHRGGHLTLATYPQLPVGGQGESPTP